MHTLRPFKRDEKGAAAVEFALILPALMFLIFGALNLFLITYAAVNLHSATQAAARWASVQTADGSTPTQATVSTYAKTQLVGFVATPTFTYTSAQGKCGATSTSGYVVAATGSYKLYYGFGTKNFTLKADACFP